MIDKEESFMELQPQEIQDRVASTIQYQLMDDWVNANLDEGLFYADKQVALMSGEPYIMKCFNIHWGLTPEDDDYLGEEL